MKRKLSDEQVREIHKSTLPISILAGKYDVCRMTIWRIKTGQFHQYLKLGCTKKYAELRLERELNAYHKRVKEEGKN